MIQMMAPNMDMCCELQKLPGLLAHYEEHKSFDDDGFFEFLVEDYFSHEGDNEGHHSDNNHEDLPFHGQHQCNHAPVFLTHSAQSIRLDNPLAILVSTGSRYLFACSSEYSETIIQPPQS